MNFGVYKGGQGQTKCAKDEAWHREERLTRNSERKPFSAVCLATSPGGERNRRALEPLQPDSCHAHQPNSSLLGSKFANITTFINYYD